jgi:hypothetical protein
MADEVILTGYAEDSQIKKYLQNVMLPRVFHDIPTSVLNTGAFSIFSEYMSQAMENLAFTSAFYFNESFITKAVLADSIYAEAAIFNLGYAYAIPSSCNFLLELKIEDIMNNATYNSDTNYYEFILDKNTKFNLSNGNVYSLDYDILIQYKTKETATSGDKAWDIHYIMENDQNSIATNKNTYIMHRVTDKWLCLMIQANEYERSSYTIVNTSMNGIPNPDTVVSCTGHICGFDIKYIDSEVRKTGIPKYIAKNHILPIHAMVKDMDPYVHYIMDNPQTIRFMWQLNGSKYFVPEVNSTFEIIVYTSHGSAANFTAFNNTDQPNVIASTTKYSNNGNVLKAAFVISGSVGGTDIGNSETVRRETIQAYNTANDISSDHDLDEWFKTFYFKNVLYPFFFKRRDDPWGRLWSGYIALKDDDDYVFRTNTLHGLISYKVLYENNDNTVTNNEIIIPPGWIWQYATGNDYHVIPVTTGESTVETAKTFKLMGDDFVFANPFGIRIQKDPFAIGYFNPWINESVTANKINSVKKAQDVFDSSEIYHAYPIITNIVRTFKDDYYKMSSIITPTIATMNNGEPMLSKTKDTAILPIFDENMWKYFIYPQDEYASRYPILPLSNDKKRYLPFNPAKTFMCISTKITRNDGMVTLSSDDFSNLFWIKDGSVSGAEPQEVDINIIGGNVVLVGDSALWNSDRCIPHYSSGSTVITLTRQNNEYDDQIVFTRADGERYYRMSLDEVALRGKIDTIAVQEVSSTVIKRYGETNLYTVSSYNHSTTVIHIKFADRDDWLDYTISNASAVYIPYDNEPEHTDSDWYHFDMSNIGASGVFLYAAMKPEAEAGSIDHYEISFADIMENEPMFYIENQVIDFSKNNMRVILHAMVNGSETGRIEMIPVTVNSDGSFLFEASIYPLNELVDIDNRINIASRQYGGGSWISTTSHNVYVDATDPEFKISILIKSQYPNHTSEIGNDPSYEGYIIADEYKLEKFSLVQELKEMRSVVNFGDTATPAPETINTYNEMMSLIDQHSSEDNIYDIIKFINNHLEGTATTMDLESVKLLSLSMEDEVNTLVIRAKGCPHVTVDEEAFDKIESSLHFIGNWNEQYQISSRSSDQFVEMYYNDGNMYADTYFTTLILPEPDKYYCDMLTGNFYYQSQPESTIVKSIELMIWEDHLDVLNTYDEAVENAFSGVNIHSGMMVQLMPFVEYSLMNSDRFPSFVSSFTQVHKAIEPVIFSQLDGNNYLDTKLIATYGKPHSYTTEYHKDKDDDVYWPDLNIQIEFDIALKNQSIANDTLAKLRGIIKSYFSKITSIHTARDQISMDNNIYITELIRQMLEEKSNNIAYLKFVGWYTQDRYSLSKNSKFMDANIQSIVQKWQKIDDFPKNELERFTPEMFIIEDSNIIFNVL